MLLRGDLGHALEASKIHSAGILYDKRFYVLFLHGQSPTFRVSHPTDPRSEGDVGDAGDTTTGLQYTIYNMLRNLHVIHTCRDV